MALAPFISARESPYLSPHNTGLGNVLFQIASTYGISKLLNKRISYHYLHEFGKMLKERYNYDHQNTIFRNFTEAEYAHEPWYLLWEKDKGQYEFDSNVVNQIQQLPLSVLRGYVEYCGYFRGYESEIRSRLQPDPASLTLLQSRYPYLFSDLNTVSVHFRLHEYTSEYRGAYYETAIKYAKTHIKDPLFIVFTDDPTGLQLSSLGLDEAIIMSNEVDYLDLWAMSFCKHHITSISTFSFWGTFINPRPDKIIISDKTCYRGWYPDSVKV